MKALLIVIRIMVAISMPATGFFLAMAAEGPYSAFGPYHLASRQIREHASKAPADIGQAEAKVLETIGPSLRFPRACIEQLSCVGLVVCSTLCGLSMWAGRQVKNHLKHTTP